MVFFSSLNCEKRKQYLCIGANLHVIILYSTEALMSMIQKTRTATAQLAPEVRSVRTRALCCVVHHVCFECSHIVNDDDVAIGGGIACERTLQRNVLLNRTGYFVSLLRLDSTYVHATVVSHFVNERAERKKAPSKFTD